MKIGIIGTGGIAKIHSRIIKSVDPSVRQYVYDKNLEIAKEFSEKYNCEYCASIDELWKKADSVIISTPNSTHFGLVLEAVKNDKNILCEKPMSLDLSEAKKMLEVGKANNLICCNIGFNYRRLAVTKKIKQLIENNDLGEIIKVYISFKRSSAITRKKFTWRDGMTEKFTSGALGDLGVHLIDMLHFIFNSKIDLDSCKVKMKTNVSEKQNNKVWVDDESFVSGRLENEVYFDMFTSKSSEPGSEGLIIEIIGTEKNFYYNSAERNIFKLKSNLNWEEHELTEEKMLPDPEREFFGWMQSFKEQASEWINSIEGGKTPKLADFGDGLNAQTVLNGLIEKSQNN